MLVLWQLVAIDWTQPMLPTGEHLGREQLMLDVGRGLAESLPANAVVAAPEIGALGYASNLHILDTVGLISPVALGYYPLPPDQLVTDNAIPPRLIAGPTSRRRGHPGCVCPTLAPTRRGLPARVSPRAHLPCVGVAE